MRNKWIAFSTVQLSIKNPNGSHGILQGDTDPRVRLDIVGLLIGVEVREVVQDDIGAPFRAVLLLPGPDLRTPGDGELSLEDLLEGLVVEVRDKVRGDVQEDTGEAPWGTASMMVARFSTASGSKTGPKPSSVGRPAAMQWRCQRSVFRTPSKSRKI